MEVHGVDLSAIMSIKVKEYGLTTGVEQSISKIKKKKNSIINFFLWFSEVK